MNVIPQSTLIPGGPQAARIGYLWWVFFWVTAVVFVLVVGFLLYSLVKRRREGERATESQMFRGVAAATAVTVIVMFGLLIASASTSGAISSLPNENALQVDIMAHQWWWDVTYPDQVSSRIVKTANEIHIPVGRTVMFRLLADDVIHSFWVPNLHGKIDLIPSRVNTIWIRADQAGTYRGQCAEFCGAQHAHMAFFVIAEPNDAFNAWLANQRQESVIPGNDLQQTGRQVFLGAPCVLCHTIRGTDAAGNVGPDLTHLATRATIAAGTLPNGRGNLMGWVTDSQSIKPGNHMPPINLKPEDVQPLLAYLESLK